jgi:hypothetical protein
VEKNRRTSECTGLKLEQEETFVPSNDGVSDVEYNFFKDCELSYKDKQRNIRYIVRKIQIFGMKSRCSAFNYPEK